MPVLPLGEAADTVLHDDHRAIDNDPEVQRTQTQQVAADAVLDHAGDRKQHGQRDHAGGDDRGTNVSEEQE